MRGQMILPNLNLKLLDCPLEYLTNNSHSWHRPFNFRVYNCIFCSTMDVLVVPRIMTKEKKKKKIVSKLIKKNKTYTLSSNIQESREHRAKAEVRNSPKALSHLVQWRKRDFWWGWSAQKSCNLFTISKILNWRKMQNNHYVRLCYLIMSLCPYESQRMLV